MSNLEKSAVAMNLVKVSFTLTPKKGNAKEYSIYVQFSSVVQLCPTLWDPIDCSMPGFLIHHQLPEFTQSYVHLVVDTIQPFHPLSSPSPPPFNLSQHQGLFKWVSSSHQVAKVLELQLQAAVLPMSIQGWSPLGLTGLTSLRSNSFSRVFSSTTIWKHQFFGVQPSS